MRDHPLTPMTDANLVRVLQAQLATTRRRRARAAARRPRRPSHGRRFGRGDRRALRGACATKASRSRSPTPSTTTTCCASARRSSDLPLVCAGSGLAIGLPRELRHLGLRARRRRCRRSRAFARSSRAAARRRPTAQVARLPAMRRRGAPGRSARARRRRRTMRWSAGIVAWAASSGPPRPSAPVLVYSTAPPQAVAAAQAKLGGHDVGARLERMLAAVARGLVESGARRLVVAGGETSGACVQALGVARLRIGAPDRSRRALVPCRAGARCRRPAPGAEVGQLRRRRFLRSAPSRCAHERSAALRDEICRVGRSLHARGYVHGTTGNISARLTTAS